MTEFRKMVRAKQAISEEECIQILKTQLRGVLSVLGENDYPYGVPIDHWYNEENGKIYFHGSKVGHKIDAMKKHDKVSFCVYDEGYKEEGDWALNIKSVVIFGRVKFVEDKEEAMDICRKLCYKFTNDNEYIEHEIKYSGPGTLVIEMSIDHMTGKLVNEA